MAAQTSGDMLPRALRKAGPLPPGKAVLGRVLSVITRPLAGAISSGPTSQPALPAAQPHKTGSKGKYPQKKGGKSKAGKGKASSSDTVMEIYLCGGTSGMDVLLLEVWDEAVRERLDAPALSGAVVRVQNCLVVPHSDKTKSFTTSRVPVYLKALPDFVMEEIADVPAFLRYHPVTPIESLVRLEPKTLVCVAGRVVPPAPAVTYVRTGEAEPDVPVAHVMLRAHGDVVKISFWRDTASKTNEAGIAVGNLVMINGVAKQFPGKDMDPRRHVALRAVSRTVVSECPDSLREHLKSTPDTAEGATLWSPEVHVRKDYEAVPSEWMTLSVLDALCKAGQVREILKVFQVPSVHIELEDAPTYMACSKCSKAWAEAAWPPCGCWSAASAEARVPRWRGKIVMRDGTASLKATCFHAFQSIADIAAEEAGQDAATPEGWQSDTVVAKAMSYVCAVPLTVLVTLAGDAWATSMQATVQLVQKTFSDGRVSHPLKVPLHLTPTEGACPPCELSASSYDAGLGLTVVSNIALYCFRALVKVRDAGPAAAGDGDEAHGTRAVSCAFAADKTYQVLVRDDDVGLRLRELDQDAYVHAVLAWESSDRLCATAFVLAPEPVESFKKFFAHEIALQTEAIDAGPSFPIAIGDTPSRMVSAAEQANTTSPPMWKVRKTIETA